MSSTSMAAAAGTGWTTRQRLVAWLAVAALTLGLVIAVATPTGRRELAMSFTERPAVYTELYFAPEGPVARTSRGQTHVRFAIRSHEARTMDFPYVVTAYGKGRSATTAGSISLRVGELGDIEAIVPTGGLRWERVEVRLRERGERLEWFRTANNQVALR